MSETKNVAMYLRMPEDVHAAIKKDAQVSNRTLNAEVEFIARTYFDADALRARLAVLEARHD